MKIIHLFILLTFVFNHLLINAQIKLKSGGYRTLKEIHENDPSFKTDFRHQKRKKSQIKWRGGNDFDFNSIDGSVEKKTIYDSIWAIVENDSIYIDGSVLTGMGYFVKVEVEGKFCFVRPAYPINESVQNNLGLNNPRIRKLLDESYDNDTWLMSFGAFGGMAFGMKMALTRIPVVYDLENGEVKLLHKETMEELLSDYPVLKEEFAAQYNQVTGDQLIDFLKRLNNKIAEDD